MTIPFYHFFMVLFMVFLVFDHGRYHVNSFVAATTDTTTSSSSLRNISTFPTLDFLFPLSALDDAWERHPVLVKSSLSEVAGQDDSSSTSTKGDSHDDYGFCTNSINILPELSSGYHSTTSCSSNHIPTVVSHNEGSIEHANSHEESTPLYSPSRRLSKIQTLISPNDVFSIIYPPPSSSSLSSSSTQLRFGTDFHVVKRITRDGKDWVGSLPEEYVQSTTQLYEAFSRGGFSIVIDGVEKYWDPVRVMAQSLQKEIVPTYVSCNMYMTPPPLPKAGTTMKQHRQTVAAFDAHWDWMDVIIVQVFGQKLWSVAKCPRIELSTSDQRYSPSPLDITQYLDYKVGRYDEFLLEPGDVLYIPRGHIHNASTVALLDDPVDESGSSRRQDEQQRQQQFRPSLHLTFGIEHRCQTTIEAMIHHAIELYAQSILTHHQQQQQQSMNQQSDLAIHAVNCPAAGGRDIPWKDVAHLAVAEVARRDDVCRYGDGKFTAYDATTTTATTEPLRSCVLRHSAALPGSYKATMSGHVSAADEAPERVSSITELEMSTALDIVIALVDPLRTAEFVEKLEHGRGENIRTFCHPFLSKESTVPCPIAVAAIDGEYLVQYMKDMKEFATKNFSNIQESWKRHLQYKGHLL